MPDVDGQIVLGLDIAQTTQQMSQDLDTVLKRISKKEITLSAKIDNINFGNAAAQIRNATNQINQEFNSTLNVIDLVNGGIGNLSRMLQGAGFSKGSISTVTQDLQRMSLQINKITTTMSQNGNIQLKISGTDELQRVVTIIRQYDSETGKVVNTSKTFVQSFQNNSKAVGDFSKKLEQVQNAIASNKIEAAISSLNAKFESLGSTGHERLAAIQADLQTLNSLQHTMSTAQNNSDLVSAYQQYEQVLARVKNNLTIVTEAIKGHSTANSESKRTVDDLSRSLQQVQNALATNKIEASITSVTSQFNQLGSTGHEKLSQIQADIQTLNSLQQTMKTSTDNSVLVSSYQQYEEVLARVKNNLLIVTVATRDQATATKEAAQAQNTLNKSATLSNKIELWMNQNAKAAEKYREELKKLQNTLKNNTDASKLTSVSTAFAKIQSEAKAAGLTTNTFAQSIKNVGLQLLGLTSGVVVIRRIISAIREGVSTIIELDDALVDLQKTTTMSGADLVAFYSEANKAAKELGVTTKDIIQSAADWSRLGFSDKKSSEMMAKLAAQFSAISPGVDMNQSTTGLVSVIKAYGIEVEDVLDGVMSKINIVGNTAATSNQEIIAGLQNSAAAMAAMNSTLDENIALFTAAQEISQDASKVGNALRTIAMRIRGYDEETQQLSDDLANISGEVIDLTKTVSRPMGVSLFTDETQTEYKSVYQYLKEISEIYDELGAKEQQQLMEKLFGKMRASIGQAILQNFSAAEKAMDNMSKSAGNANAEMEIITESLTYKLNALRETAVGIMQDIFPRESIGAFIDAGTSLLELLDSIIEACGGLGNTLLILVDVIALLNFSKTVVLVQNLWSALSTGFGLLPKLISMFGNLKAAWVLGKEAGGGFIATLKNAASALIGTGSAASIATAGIMGVVAVIGIAVALYTNWKRKQEEARRELIESGNEAAENAVKVKDLAVKYLELNDAVDAGIASVEDATAARDDLIEALSLEEDKIDELITKYGDYKTAIIEAARESIRTDVNTAVAGANAAKDQVVEDLKTGWFGGNVKYISVIGNKEDEVKAVKDALELLDSLSYEGIDNTVTKGGFIFLPSVYLTGGDTAKASFDDLMADYEYLENAMNDVIEKFGADNPVAEELASLYNEYADELKPAIAAIEAANRGIASDLVLAQRAISDPKTQEEFEGFRQAIIDNMESDIRFDDRVGSVENYVDSILSENDTYKKWLDNLGSQERVIDEITRKKTEIVKSLVEMPDFKLDFKNIDFKNIFGGIQDFASDMNVAIDEVNTVREYLESLSDEQINLVYDLIINSRVEGLDELKTAIEAANIENIVSKDKLKEYEELFSNYQSVLNEAGLLGIDLSNTVYGNIDTNNRQILEWTDENLATYKDAIESWGATVDEMRGSISTVFGSSSEYDGVEIAFSPILQTENGPVLLDSHTVDEYIWGLIDKAGEGWTNESLLRLDTEGLEMDGQIIKNLLADIGDAAIHTGEAMHFTGEAGAVNEMYDAIKEAAEEAGISVEAFMYYFEHTGNQIAIQAKNIRDSLKGMWDSEDFADTKASLIQMANTLDGITGQNIKDLAEDSSALKSILDQNGMSAEFLAKVLQTVADGEDGFALITESALLLNQALEGMVRDFDQVTEAKSRYDAAMSVPEKDEEFKSYAEAFKALNEQFEAGTTNSNAFWAAAEFLFGAEQLQTWGWSDGLNEIYAAMQKNVSIFEDADSAGAGFLERLYEIAENGKVLDEDGNILATIEKFTDGSFTFDIDATSIDEIAQKLGITEEAALSCLKALSMWGDIDFYNVEEVLDAIEKIGLSSDSLEGTAINIDALTDQLISLGYTNKDIYDLLQTLQGVEGVTFLSASSDVDTLTNSLTNLGLATDDGIEVKVNTESLSILMEQLSFTKEDAQGLITKLDEADGITLTNAKGEVQDLQSVLQFIDTLDFATVESKVNSLGESIDDVDASSTDNAQSQLEAIGTSAETAESKVHDLQTTINGLTGKTVTVSVDVKRKNSLLSMLGFAKGTKNAPDGAALTGEEGAELIKSGDQAYLAGTNGPEIVHLNQGDTVYTAEETKDILKSGKYLSGSIPAYSGGYNGGASGTIKPKGGTYKSVLSGNNSSTTTKELKDAVKETENLEDALEDTLKKMKEVMDDLIGDYEHTIFIMEHKGVNSNEIIKIYKAMQDAVHQQAEEYRALGLDENSDYIQELQKQWWEYQDSIQDLIIETYEKSVKEHENAITLNENWLDKAITNKDFSGITRYTSDIISHYKAMQDEIHQQAEYYRSLGYSDTSDEVSKLSDLWWDYYDKIAETSANAWQQVVDNVNDAVDEITGLYDTLKDAAQEYADSGFITIDTLQEICSWGVQYLAYLKDENGQLVINEESLQKVIAARTEQMAVETALSYVQQIRSAIERNEITELMNLTLATEQTTTATWDLVYAQLRLLNVSGDLNDTMYAGALQNINNLRALSGIAISSIGKVEGSVKEANESAKKALKEQGDYLDDLLKYVMEMIKQEVKNQIEALENQVDKMKDIVDLQKKSLELEREKDNYTKNVAEKTKELAKLQQQLALLELDDSRESAAKQAKLKEEIADLSNDLADDQADHAYDATSDMLDDMFDAYEKEKKKEIEVLENSISSEEKLYQLAIERIQTQWDTLYQQLLDWNYEYGTVTNNEITAAWDAACIAVEKYGSYLNAVLQTQQQLTALEASSSSSSSSTIIGGGLTGTSTTPNVIGNSGNYDTSGGQETENVHNIIKKMYANSRAWGNASESERKRLDAENLQLGQSLARYGINAYRDNGTWYTSDGSLLYEKYKKYTYHTGGIVGDDPTLKQDELFAKLKKGEAVFTKEQQKPIYQALDFAETMLGKYGKVINSISDTDLMGSRMQEQIKQDAQQTQTVVENSGMSNEFNLTFPMQVLQKLDDAEIKSLTKKISNYTIKELDSVFTMRGKRSLRY